MFAVSYGVFFLIKKTIGMRVTAEEELAGLDISEHGMYGYPEQFIPAEEYGFASVTPTGRAATPAPTVSATAVSPPSNA